MCASGDPVGGGPVTADGADDRGEAVTVDVGVLSGALAGGLEERAVFHHLALFRDRP